MIDRTWKVLLAVGLVIGVCAIAIALIGDNHFKPAALTVSRS